VRVPRRLLATFVDAADRAALERLARYDRVGLRPDGRVEYRFRRLDPTGRTAVPSA